MVFFGSDDGPMGSRGVGSLNGNAAAEWDEAE